jgi:hypothetical protein
MQVALTLNQKPLTLLNERFLSFFRNAGRVIDQRVDISQADFQGD